MPTYIGFSTINADKPKTTNAKPGSAAGTGGITNPIIFGKKFKTVDTQLVIQDLVNALNIPLGQKVGQPGYGTTVWSYVFEPNTADTQRQIENEIRRVANLDPRIQLNYVQVYPRDNGILVEIEMAVNPFNEASVLSMFFNQDTSVVSPI
jgi:phage baseplate assembly protein W